MSQIEVPDWVLDEALAARLPDGSSVRFQITTPWEMTTMRAALTAALGAWVVPVGYQETITVQDDGVFADIERKLWHWIPGKPIPESTADTFREPIFTLRQEKPE